MLTGKADVKSLLAKKSTTLYVPRYLQNDWSGTTCLPCKHRLSLALPWVTFADTVVVFMLIAPLPVKWLRN